MHRACSDYMFWRTLRLWNCEKFDRGVHCCIEPVLKQAHLLPTDRSTVYKPQNPSIYELIQIHNVNPRILSYKAFRRSMLHIEMTSTFYSNWAFRPELSLIHTTMQISAFFFRGIFCFEQTMWLMESSHHCKIFPTLVALYLRSWPIVCILRRPHRQNGFAY